MSSAGFPSSAFMVAPDLAAQQMQLQQRQALAQSLLGNKSEYSGFGGAADTFGSRILGAILQRNANKQALDLGRQYQGSLANFLGGSDVAPQQPQGQPQQPGIPPLGSLPPSVAQPSQDQAGGTQPSPQQPPLSSLPPGGPQAPPRPVAGTPGPLPTMAQQPPQEANAGFGIPGTTARQRALEFMFGGPQEYAKAVMAQQAQEAARTNEYKNALIAVGGDPAKAAQLLGAQATKAGAIDLRAEGSALVPDVNVPGGYRRFYGPNENLNEQFVEGPNGTMIARPIEGGAEAAAAFRGRVKGAEEENTVKDVTLPNGKVVPMYLGTAIGAAPSNTPSQPLGLRNNNPGNMQPGGHEASYANPTAGILAASGNLDNYAKNGINTLGGIISTWAPQYDKSGKQINDTPAYIADVSKRLGGVDPTKPLNLADPNVKGAILEAMFQHEDSNKFAAPNAGGTTKPPELGVSTAQQEINKAAGEAASNSGHVQATSDALLKAIDGMIAINDQVPDATVLPPDWKARINEAAPNLPGFRGDAGALAQWEQLNSIGVLGGIKNLGLGRVDIPIVKQIQAGGGIPANVPAADRLRMLQTLKTEVINNRAVAQNVAANLNNPNAATPPQTPTQSYPSTTPKPQVNQRPHPQDIVDELRKRGVVK